MKGVSSEFDSSSKNEAEKEGKDGWVIRGIDKLMY